MRNKSKGVDAIVCEIRNSAVLVKEHFNHPKGMFRAAPSGDAFGLLTGRVLLEPTCCHRCTATFNAISFRIKIISILEAS